jgi:mono/diheme cytochrome c family protein
MYPPPPALLHGTGVTDDPVGRTHWVIQNGIRMTGMPGFKDTYSDEQIWDIALLLARASHLPASVQQLLNQPDTAPVQAAR